MEDNTKLIIKDKLICRLDSTSSQYGPVQRPSEQRNEISDCIKDGKFPDKSNGAI
jgi:hypothetical protein